MKITEAMSKLRALTRQYGDVKPTRRAAIEAVILGTIGSALLGWFVLPGAVWGVHVIIWLGLISGVYEARIKVMAHETIIDS